jgi:hypothetical protein
MNILPKSVSNKNKMGLNYILLSYFHVHLRTEPSENTN